MGVINMDPCTAGADLTSIWDSNLHASYVAGAGRNGGGALRLTGGTGTANATKSIVAISECWRHFALSFSSTPGSDQEIMQILDSGNAQIRLRLLTNLSLQFVVGSTLVGSPTTLLLSPGVKYRFALHLLVSATSGLAELRLNGSPSTLLTFSGNTKATSNSTFNQLAFHGPSSVNFDFSDIYDLDNSGSPTVFQGDQFIGEATLTGDSATSGKNQFATTPAQTTGNHHLNVIDGSDLTFNSDATVGDVERYRFSLPSSIAPTVLAALVKGNIDTAGSKSIGVGFSSGGVDSLGSDFSLPSSPGWAPLVALANDPSTSAPWGSNPSAEVLVKVTA